MDWYPGKLLQQILIGLFPERRAAAEAIGDEYGYVMPTDEILADPSYDHEAQAQAVSDAAMGTSAEDILFPEKAALRYKIEEGIGDYGRAIADIEARIGETRTERDRRIEATRAEGILSLKEQGAQAAHEGRMAMTQAEMIASSAEHRIGASGMRMRGSPLMAAQQNVDLAFAAADRTIERGRTGVAIGGLRLKTGLADIGAQTSLLTSEYQRRQAELTFKKSELETNKQKMLQWATVGSITDLASSFYKVGSTLAGL